jgi:hypothetical protein
MVIGGCHRTKILLEQKTLANTVVPPRRICVICEICGLKFGIPAEQAPNH